jgi:hypothetical protein
MALARVACPSAWVGGGACVPVHGVLGVLKEGFVGGEYLRLHIHREEPQLQIELFLPVRQLLRRREPAMAVPYYGVLYYVWGTQGATEGTR